MSGEGLCRSSLEVQMNPRRPIDERADLVADLRRKRANAATMASRNPEFAEQARDRGRQLDVMIEEIEAGLHVGAAAVEAQLGQSQLGSIDTSGCAQS